MLVYYQMKNLIQCFTEILEYLLCFENDQQNIDIDTEVKQPEKK